MSDRTSGDREVARLAAAQHGLVTLGQAIRSGLSRRGVERRLGAGRWQRVQRGVYRVAGAPASWRQQVMAACLVTGGVACRRTAAALYGLLQDPSSTIEVVVQPSRCPRPAGILVHRADVPCSDRGTVDGIPVTSPTRTILDLAAVLPVEALEICLDAALRRRAVDVEALHARVAGRGARKLRSLLRQRSDSTAVCGSVLETLFLRNLRRAGLPEPRVQWPIRRGGRVVAVVDFAYPEQRLVIEIDGYRYHSGRRDWQRDLARQNEIVACGFDILRFTSSDIQERPDEICARVAIVLARSKP